MGTYNKGILGPFLGTVGPVVGSTFRGKDVMRSRPRKSSKPATALQLEQRAKFRAVMLFLVPARMLISLFFGTSMGSKSRFDLAVSYHIQNAVNYVAGLAQIDYTKVVFAKGNLLPPQNLECKSLPNAELELKWVDNSKQAGTLSTDQLMVVVLEEKAEEYQFFLNVAERVTESVIVTLPPYLSGTNVYVYAFMVAADGKTNSTSQHLAIFTVQ